MMILLAICAIISLLNILSFTAHGIISGIIYGAVYGYLFVCIYSLYTMLREEHERGFTAQYQTPGGPIPQYPQGGQYPQYPQGGQYPQVPLPQGKA